MIRSLPKSAGATRLQTTVSAKRLPPPRAALRAPTEKAHDTARTAAATREHYARALEFYEAEMVELSAYTQARSQYSGGQNDAGVRSGSKDDDDDLFDAMNTLCICSYDEDD